VIFVIITAGLVTLAVRPRRPHAEPPTAVTHVAAT
jgi:hypothetical protein